MDIMSLTFRNSYVINKKRYLMSLFMSWLIFIMIDFVMNASIFAHFWLQELTAIKSLSNLAILIPAGYLSFLLLSAFFGWIMVRIYPVMPGIAQALKFGIITAGLFSLSHFLSTYSYINLPAVHLGVMSFTYLIEIMSVTLIFYFLYYSDHLNKRVLYVTLVFVGGLIIGIIIQNVMGIYNLS